MLRRKMKKFKLRKYVLKKDSERNTVLEYLDPIEDEAIIWPAGGKVQAELYGLRLAYMLNMNYYGSLDIKENDGICINSDDPDYKVVSIREYPRFRLLELEMII